MKREGGRKARAFATCCGIVTSFAVLGFAQVEAPPARAAQGPALEYQVKAVFLLRIAQFTEWPPSRRSDTAPFVIGLVGRDPFGATLEQAVAGERIGGREVVVRRFADVGELGPADLLFVSASHRETAGRVVEAVGDAPTLTVADFEGFADQGGAVELYVDQGHVRFRINRRAAEAAGLSLRARLLRAAAAVD